MNIVIAGAGKVGFNIAKNLSHIHNVVIIDKNEEALSLLKESLDILTIKGNVEDSNIYKNFDNDEIDIFIAVTNDDNTNIVATLAASKNLQIKRKILRLRRLFFKYNHFEKIFDETTLVFPLEISSNGVSRLLKYPKANNVKNIRFTQNKLISVRINKEFEELIIDKNRAKIIGIERENKFYIFDDSLGVKQRDLIYFFGDEVEVRKVCKSINSDEEEILNCVIYGANDLGIEIAKSLLKENKNVKILEKDIKLCLKADEELKGEATIINAKYSVNEYFKDEAINLADIFISATDDDEFNIIKSLEAKDKGVKKVISINNELEYYNLMHSLDIVVVRGPKISAYNHIVERISSSKLVIEKNFCGNKASYFLRKVYHDSKLIEKEIKTLKLKNIKLYIIRDEKIIDIQTYENRLTLMENDLIIVFTANNKKEKVREWLYGL